VRRSPGHVDIDNFDEVTIREAAILDTLILRDWAKYRAGVNVGGRHPGAECGDWAGDRTARNSDKGASTTRI
jgi:hypothetical protein